LKIIIVGAGEVGFHIAQRLSFENKEVLVIDRNPDALKRIAEHLDVQTYEGSGSSPKVLADAGIHNTDILLAVTDSDETNLIACMFANMLAPHTVRLARIRNEDYTAFQSTLTENTLHINMIINPDVEVVKSIMRLMSVPGAIEISEFAGGKIKLIGVRIDSHSPLHGTRLMHLRDKAGLIDFIIGALVRENRLIIPTGKDAIHAGDVVYFLCDEKNLQKVLRFFGKRDEPIKNVLIVGGGNVGFKLAEELDRRKTFHTRLVERDPERCELLAANLDRTVVLNGDGTDQELLQEENIAAMDVVISLTGDEETNILSCLLSKSLGAKRTITRINKFAYMPLVQAIGIDHLVSPRLSAVNSILHNIRRGKVISTVSIKGDEAEALEAIALENSYVVGRPLKDLNFPKGALILCILRDDSVLIPTGDSVIDPQDRIIILSTRSTIHKVEYALTVKLEYF